MTPSSAQAVAAVGGTVILGLSIVGFLRGTEQAHYDFETPLRHIEEHTGSHDLAPAPTYLALRHQTKTATTLPTSLAALEVPPPTGPSQASLAQALADRAKTRAFHGAPPVIPHPVRQSSAAECLACHDRGLWFGALRATPIPHEPFTSCTQCHAMAEPDLPWGERSDGLVDDPRAVDNAFVGAAAPTGGAQWTPLAPPVIPHDTFLHERCMSCHGPYGHDPLQTPHPERQSCEQCHPATAALEQRPGGR